MGFVECIRVGAKGAEAGIGTKQDRPPTIFGARVVSRVSIAEDTSAQGDEPACRCRMLLHLASAMNTSKGPM